MESRRNGPQLSSRHDDDDKGLVLALTLILSFNRVLTRKHVACI